MSELSCFFCKPSVQACTTVAAGQTTRWAKSRHNVHLFERFVELQPNAQHLCKFIYNKCFHCALCSLIKWQKQMACHTSCIRPKCHNLCSNSGFFVQFAARYGKTVFS